MKFEQENLVFIYLFCSFSIWLYRCPIFYYGWISNRACKSKAMYGSKLSEFWYSMLFTHITTSIVALVIGPFTLSTKFRERNINRHRIAGRIYMVGILLGGLSGLYLSFYATGGLVAKLGLVCYPYFG